MALKSKFQEIPYPCVVGILGKTKDVWNYHVAELFSIKSMIIKVNGKAPIEVNEL